jgi:hypothetical protein
VKKYVNTILMAAFVMTGPSLAFADDANFVMAIKNDTIANITVEIDPWHSEGEHSSCITLAKGTDFSTPYEIKPNATHHIAFWRSGECHGLQGWLGMRAYGAPLPKQRSEDDFQQFWFSANGGFAKKGTNSAYQNSLETFGVTIGPTVPLVLHIQSAMHVTVERALQNGCSTRAELQRMMGNYLPPQSYVLGSKTREKMTAFQLDVSGDWATKSLVTDPNVRVYRGTDIPRDTYWLESYRLISKFANMIAKEDGDTSDFIATNGPRLDYRSEAGLVQSLKMLATQNSDEPKSQSISLAVSHSVGSGFGFGAVYAFRLNPSSPLLGLRGCALGSGEVQFQGTNNSQIHDLYKKTINPNQWYKFDPRTKTWFPSTAPAN